MSDKIKWKWEADYMQACNCDYGCPCEFNAPPTRGFCEGVGAWLVRRGQYGNVSLDGLGLGFAAHWPKAMHEGNGTVCLLIDQKANAAQRDALLQIGSGKAGGLPFEIVATTFSKILDPMFVSFEFKSDGNKGSVRMGDAVLFDLSPIRNPVTGQPESVAVQHSTGFMFQQAECVAADQLKVNAGSLKYSWPSKAGFIAKVKYAN